MISEEIIGGRAGLRVHLGTASLQAVGNHNG